MEVMQRRKATPEELKQGMEQMMAAQERLSKEATEEPIEDIPGSHSDVAQGKEPRLEDAQEFLDVVVMVHLSCFVVFFVSTQHFAAMELGQSVSITAGKYAGNVVLTVSVGQSLD